MRDEPGVPRDRGARPSLEEVLTLRRDRMDTVRQVIDDLDDDKLDGRTEPVDAPGWPKPESYPVRSVLLCILNEEWQHRLYAERDLDVLESRSSQTAPHRCPKTDRDRYEPRVQWRVVVLERAGAVVLRHRPRRRLP